MHKDVIFDESVERAREEGYVKLKNEMKSVEKVIEKFLSQMLECTASISERDFNIYGI